MNRWLAFSVVLTLLAFAASGYIYWFHYEQLPDPMPTHWDWRGEPDQFLPRSQAFLLNFLLTPCLMALWLLVTLVLPWLSPRQFDVNRFRPTYDYIMALVITLFGFIYLTLALSSFQPEKRFIHLLIGGLLLFFALIGNVLGQVKRNFWIGVRTPWTLASETVWERTHRLTAWLWVPFGLLAGIAVLAIPGETVLLVAAAALLVVIFLPVVYSLVLYKQLERQGRLSPSE